MKSALYAAVMASLCLATCSAWAAPAPGAAGEDVYAAAAKYEFGQSRKPLAAIEEQIRKAPPAEYRAIEAKLLAILKAPGTTVDAKRFFCRYLGIVGSAQSVPALAALLGDEKLSDPARIALEPMANPAAGAALRKALGQVKGKLLAGVIGSVGARRDAEAVPALAALTADADGDVARAAIAALGAIGTADAAKALDQAAAKAPQALRRPVAQARFTCAANLAQAGKSAEAAAIYRTLLETKDAPATRLAALRGLIAAQGGAEGARLVIDMLQGNDDAMRAATLTAFAASTDQALKNAVVQQLPALNTAAQQALLGLLPDQRDVAARPALLKLIQDAKDESTRLLALDCLATHGQADDVAMLVKLAMKGGGAEAAVARRVLERMSGAGVNDAIAKLLESPDAGTRNLAVALVTSRRSEAAMPVLVKMAGGADAAAAAEAVKALASLGTPAELPALVKTLTGTGDAAVRTAVEGAVAAICGRTADREACAKVLVPALDTTAAPAARASLLQLLPRVKTPDALAAAQKVLKADKDPAVVQAAVRALADWPDISAAPALMDFAKTAPNATDAVLAMRGCLRLAGLKDQPVAERLAAYRGVLELAQRPDEKKQALAGLADVPSPDALDLLAKYAQDAALGADATQATLRLARQIGPAYRQRATAALQQLKAQASAEDVRNQADEAIRALASATRTPDGTILAWMLAGPYAQEGKSGAELFDVAFPPEKAGPADWRVQVVPANAPTPGLVELNAILGGNERAAYLRTEIISPKAQPAVLELGSDDGIKVWLNGKVVHANNATRPARPGEDKTKINLKEGANTLLVKVVQGGGEWALVARLTTTDGKPLDFSVSPANQ
jgi:hypothetical protein